VALKAAIDTVSCLMFRMTTGFTWDVNAHNMQMASNDGTIDAL
jgi:hypothetical protein